MALAHDPGAAAAEVARGKAAAAIDHRLRDPTFRQEIIAARDAAPLGAFRAALIRGALVVCGNCSRFAFGADPAALGDCRHFHTEVYPFVPFYCAGFELARTPTAPAFMPIRKESP